MQSSLQKMAVLAMRALNPTPNKNLLQYSISLCCECAATSLDDVSTCISIHQDFDQFVASFSVVVIMSETI